MQKAESFSNFSSIIFKQSIVKYHIWFVSSSCKYFGGVEVLLLLPMFELHWIEIDDAKNRFPCIAHTVNSNGYR